MGKSTFKIALASFFHKDSVKGNLKALLVNVKKAAAHGCDIVCFGETVFTGMPVEKYREDLKRAISLDGPEARAMAGAAAANKIWLLAGVMEKNKGRLYDAALLYDDKGKLVHRYARISRGWHSKKVPARYYRQGRSVKACRTPFGRFAFEICGDLFYPEIRARLRGVSPDYLFCLMWRSLENGKRDRKYWESKERPEYLRQIRDVGADAFFINALERKGDDAAFGGPMVISRSGRVVKAGEFGQPAMLVCDVRKR